MLDHRLARPERAEHRGATLGPWARRRSRPPSASSASTRKQSIEVADEVIAHTRKALERGAEAKAEWEKSLQVWRDSNPGSGPRSSTGSARAELPTGWEELPVFEPGKAVATRAASGKVLQALGAVIPELWGGSADLAGSNNTTIDKDSSFLPEGNPLPGGQPVRPHHPLRHP